MDTMDSQPNSVVDISNSCEGESVVRSSTDEIMETPRDPPNGQVTEDGRVMEAPVSQCGDQNTEEVSTSNISFDSGAAETLSGSSPDELMEVETDDDVQIVGEFGFKEKAPEDGTLLCAAQSAQPEETAATKPTTSVAPEPASSAASKGPLKCKCVTMTANRIPVVVKPIQPCVSSNCLLDLVRAKFMEFLQKSMESQQQSPDAGSLGGTTQ